MKITATSSRRLAWALLIASLAPAPLPAAIPDSVPYQGRVAVDGLNFSGTGQFKFAVYEHATGNFTPAVATATISGGFLTIVTVNSGGNGYSSGVTVSFSGGGGSGATATATVAGGVITGVTMTSPGSGYTLSPTVVFNDPSGAAQLWNNAAGATTATLAEPATAVSLPVANGLYAAGLGDTALANMAALPASLAPTSGKRAFVRVWFNDGAHGFQPLSPDTELRSAPFAREAANTASIGGVSLANLARLDTANTFTHEAGFTVTGAGPIGTTPAAGATVPVTGAGARMEFLPGYGAFRAGAVSADQWAAGNIGVYSTAIGSNTIASGERSTALGFDTTASGRSATALGQSCIASGNYTTAFGLDSVASGTYATAFGTMSTASGEYSIAGGYDSTASGANSIAIGNLAAATKTAAVALGTSTTASGISATALGASTTASGNSATALGNGSTAGGLCATAMGSNTIAGSTYTTAMGDRTQASGLAATAMGGSTIASGNYSLATGASTQANGFISTAMGYSTTASGIYTTAFGDTTAATGDRSTAFGAFTTAESAFETTLGRYNTDYTPTSTTNWSATDRLFVIGNGTSSVARSDALIVYKNGNATLKGTLTQGSDRNRKTDIVPADTAAILAGVAALPLATWKYNDETTTHLGPMAQDFAAAFHLGADETGIASVDADGVALAAIQELKKQLDAKDARLAALEARLAALEAKLK